METTTKRATSDEAKRLIGAFIERVNGGKVFGFENDLAEAYLRISEYTKITDDEEDVQAMLREEAFKFYARHFAHAEDWMNVRAIEYGDHFNLRPPRHVSLFGMLIYKLDQVNY